MTRPAAQTTEAGLTALQGVLPRRRFGHLKVVRTGLRSKPTGTRPSGQPAALCRCLACQNLVIVPCYKLLNGGQTSCGCKAPWKPQGRNPDRDRILGYLREHGPARLTELAAALRWTSGKAGGQLALMMGDGEVARPFRGVWCLPGQEPAAPLPAAGDRSAAAVKSARSRRRNKKAAAR